MFTYITKSIIPIIVLVILVYGMIKGRKVYEWFLEGAKDGLKVCMNIFPCLLAMIIAVQIFRGGHLLDMINSLLAPMAEFIGLPEEIIPLVLIKPISGSGAIGIFTDTIRTYGPDSFIGILASVIMGTTETIFYTITVYFGAVKVKKIRHTLWSAMLADMAAIFAAITMVKLLLF
ncbi:MAG: spore maturation protein [Clostridium sp.]|uniref:spore maturation protein n=1 Tax=Clostridium sp. TaxID=1506 RepID=UPI003F3AE200